MTHFYIAYQLKIASAIQLTSFRQYDGLEQPDIRIIFDKTPLELDEIETKTVIKRVRFQMTSNKLLYHLLDGTRIYITNGNLITIEPSEKPDWEFIRLHVRTRVMASILHQRRYMPLHGSAIEVDGKAILFVGDSGAGKSTLAGAFIKKGYKYLADDWCVFKKDKNNQYLLQPSYPQLRFWEHSINLLDASNVLVKGDSIRIGIEKYFINPTIEMVNYPIPVQSIYLLHPHNQSKIDIKPIEKFKALKALIKHTFAKIQMDGLGGHKEQFETITYLINSANVKNLYRPEGQNKEEFWKMINIIENDFKESV